jgi:hypothetical protein
MTAALTVKIWQTSTQRGDGLVLLLALAEWAQDSGQGRMPESAWLQQATRLNTGELEATI